MKQIRDCEIVGKLIDSGKGYFHWLQDKSGLSGPLSSMLADTEFVTVDGLDDILKQRAKEEMRNQYAKDVCEDSKDIETVCKSIRGSCCLFEVILCLAYSLNEMFEDTSAHDGPEHFFGILMRNCGLDRYDEEFYDLYPEKTKEHWERCIKQILERKYDPHGFDGGLFPLECALQPNNQGPYPDRRKVSLWQQLNDWLDQHTDEDGEWVD